MRFARHSMLAIATLLVVGWSYTADAATVIYTPNEHANATLTACRSHGGTQLELTYVGNDSPLMRMDSEFGPGVLARHSQVLATYRDNWRWSGQYPIPAGANSFKVSLVFDDNTADTVNTPLSGISACDTDAPDPGTVKRFVPGTAWDWQLAITPTSVNLDRSSNPNKMINIDLFDNSAATIAALKRKGIAVVCYFSAGSYENWRPDAASFPAAALGRAMAGWPGERWLDVRSNAVHAIMEQRMDLAASKGCDAVEPDNIDGYTNRTGFPLTASHQLAYNTRLAHSAHTRGLAIALKNDVDQVAQLAELFDFAINEECNAYSECGVYSHFIRRGKAVFNAEYSTGAFKCAAMNAANIDSVLFALDLDNSRYQTCR